MKKSFCVILALLLALSCTAVAFAATYTTGNYTVNANQLYVRSGPSQNYSYLDIIVRGTEVNVSEIRGVWGYCSYGDDSVGWVMMQYLLKAGDKPTQAPTTEYLEPSKFTPGKYVIDVEILNFREVPSLDSDIIGTVPEGIAVSVTKVSGNWGYCKYNGKTGWIWLEYTQQISSEIPTTDTPTTEAPTEAPTTEPATTEIPIEIPTTDIPTTEAPVTEAPTAAPEDDTTAAEVTELTPGKFIVDANKLNMRAEADKSSEVLAVISRDSVIEVFELTDEWAYCKYDGKLGYVSVKYIKQKSADIITDKIAVLYGDNTADMTALAAAGFAGVLLPIGERKADNLDIIEDDAFKSFYADAVTAGLKAGVIFASASASVKQIQADAAWVKGALAEKNAVLSYPVYVEIKAAANSYTALASAFCTAVTDNTDYLAGVISDESMLTEKYDLKQIKDYSLLVKNCGDDFTVSAGVIEAASGIELIPGVNGDLLYAREYFDLRHIFNDWVTDTEPSCESFGSEHSKCLCCDVVMTRDIAPLGHTESEWYIDPDDSAFMITICEVCNKTVSRKIIDATVGDHEHFPENDWKLAETVTPCGIARYSLNCKICGIALYEKYELLEGHKRGKSDTVTATCTENGCINTYCAACDKVFESLRLPLAEHNVPDWKIVTVATKDKAGTKSGICADCGQEVTTSYTYDGYLLGDVNLDGVVKAADARIILRVAASLQTIDNEQAKVNADCNLDGQIKAADARLALRVAAGLQTL